MNVWKVAALVAVGGAVACGGDAEGTDATAPQRVPPAPPPPAALRRAPLGPPRAPVALPPAPRASAGLQRARGTEAGASVAPALVALVAPVALAARLAATRALSAPSSARTSWSPSSRSAS